MGLFDQFPYTNFHELNLMWILEALKEIQTTTEQFVAINSLKYANPIQWNILKQYEKNTIVIDPQSGTAYISVAAVPAGVALTDTDYWTVVFDLEQFVTKANNNFTPRVETNTTLNATFATNAGEWVVWGGELYQALSNIIAGDQYVVDSNIKRITVEDITGDLPDLTTTDKSNLVAAINEVLTILTNTAGDLNNLNTTDKSNLVAAINEVLTTTSNAIIAEANIRATNEGDLNNLNTTDKSNLVAAINEVLTTNSNAIAAEANIRATNDGDLNNLNTTDKSNLVAAINEVNTTGGGALALIGDLDNLVTTAKDTLVNAINEVANDITTLESAFITPEMYGAAGDGVTDDTAAIQSAINNSNGKAVVLRAQYNVTGKINLISNLTMIGTANNKIIDNTTLSTNLNGILDGINLDNVTLKGINIEGPNPNGSTLIMTNDIKCDISFRQCSNILVEHCSVIGSVHSFSIMFQNCNVVNVDKCHIKYYGYVGIGGYDGTSHFTVSDCLVEYSKYRETGGNQYAIVLAGYHSTTYTWGSYLKATGNICYSEEPYWEGIDAHGGSFIEVVNNIIYGFRVGIAVLTSPSSSPTFYASNANISGNIIYGVRREGSAIYTGGSSGISTGGYNFNITNNVLFECGRAYSNGASNVTCSAIGFNEIVSQFMISNNQIIAAGGNGLNFNVTGSLELTNVFNNSINMGATVGGESNTIRFTNPATSMQVYINNNYMNNYSPKYVIPTVAVDISFDDNKYPFIAPTYDNIANCKPDFCTTTQISTISLGRIGDLIKCSNDNTIAMYVCTKASPAPVYKKIAATI